MTHVERVTIRRLSEHDSLEELTELLHAAYAPLAVRGMRYTASYQGVEVTGRRGHVEGLGEAGSYDFGIEVEGCLGIGRGGRAGEQTGDQ